ncbi:MAG: glycine cleavage system protein GcvH [Deltaproteobacteria bacterium]|nr:glycine cleavage system protein GcvH [Deltaproteobacteria bacterium]
MVSEECLYTKTHEWVRIEGELAVVGITDHAQRALGDITFIELPQLHVEVERGKECATIESVKAASDIYAPISGEVFEVNASLEGAPEKINHDPYGEGWIFKLKDYNRNHLSSLLNASAYEAFLESEA